MSNRSEGLSKIIGEIIAPMVYKVLGFEEFGLVTVTKTKVSSDFSFADIFISSMKNKENIEKVLKEYIYKMQKDLNKKIRREKVPMIRFHTDYSPELMQSLSTKLKPEIIEPEKETRTRKKVKRTKK